MMWLKSEGFRLYDDKEPFRARISSSQIIGGTNQKYMQNQANKTKGD